MSEGEYYTWLFTKDAMYSSADPNDEEKLRWENIHKLIESAKKQSGKKKFEQIIDFGSGRGWLSNLLSNEGNVTGIEPVAKVVEFGKKLYPGLSLMSGNLETLKNFSADLIICSEVIEHIPRKDQPDYFKAFFHSLKNGGYLIITSPRMEAFSEWRQYLDPGQPVEDWLYESELRAYAEQAGFEVIEKLIYGESPGKGIKSVQVYQQWLFKKTN